jgi:hypothetical protein
VSRGLDQTELLEAPPTRRLIVREGHTAWYGVDPSAFRIALATIHPDGGREVSSVAFARGEGGERLAAIWDATFRFAHTRALFVRPGVITVEQPSGKQANPGLSYATGVIMGALFAGVKLATGVAVLVETVPSSRWKAVACGKGNIFKPKPRSGEEYGVLTWARTGGYQGSSWDEADALGVAEYARRTFALEER